MTTNKPEWTPGPWTTNVTSIEQDNCDGRWIASCDSRGANDSGEDDANARLIAAAPELYEAIENLLGAVDTPIARRKLGNEFLQESIDTARSALAKACGEVKS